MKADVVVIGSGGAGCRAALEAYKHGAKVILITKGLLGKSGTTAFHVADTAGYNSADGLIDSTDNPNIHCRDIIKAGLGMTDNKTVSALANDSKDTVEFLENIGVSFEKNKKTGKYIEVMGCFATKPRMHILKGHGEPIIKALIKLMKNTEIKVLEKTNVIEIVTCNNKCAGVIVIDNKGSIRFINAKTVILASGGAGQIFKNTLTPTDVTGDGYILGLNAGAELINMEFMQFVIGTVYPVKSQLNTFLWCGKPRLINYKGKEFLKKYLPSNITEEKVMEEKSKHFPFSSRDMSKYIEIAIKKEILKDKTDKERKVFLDITNFNDNFVSSLKGNCPLKEVWHLIKEFMDKEGFNISTKPIEISIFAHALNGGIRTDENGATCVKGLFAAGEIAGGAHGADRLGGNMLLASQVFGARAGRNAAILAKNQEFLKVDESKYIANKQKLTKPENKNQVNIYEMKKNLQKIMWEEVLVVKNEKTLIKAYQKLIDMKSVVNSFYYDKNNGHLNCLEFENMLDVSLIIVQAAQRRKESRGSHYRDDYPNLDQNYNFKTIIKKENNKIQFMKEWGY